MWGIPFFGVLFFVSGGYMVILKEKGYVDITTKSLKNKKYGVASVIDAKYFYDGKYKCYVDGKGVVLDYSSKEKEVAKWLANLFGETVYMLPRINYPEGIKTADYFFKNECWDLKTIKGKSRQVLYHAIYKNKTQSNNFIFDIVSNDLNIEKLNSQVQNLYNRKDTKFLQKIILRKENNIFIYKRK